MRVLAELLPPLVMAAVVVVLAITAYRATDGARRHKSNGTDSESQSTGGDRNG